MPRHCYECPHQTETEWSDLLTPVADQRVKKHGKMKSAEIARIDIKEKLHE